MEPPNLFKEIFLAARSVGSYKRGKGHFVELQMLLDDDLEPSGRAQQSCAFDPFIPLERKG